MELIILLLVYFAPWLISSLRGHRNEGAIMMLNLFLGWTLIGWVASIVWASTDNVKRNQNV